MRPDPWVRGYGGYNRSGLHLVLSRTRNSVGERYWYGSPLPKTRTLILPPGFGRPVKQRYLARKQRHLQCIAHQRHWHFLRRLSQLGDVVINRLTGRPKNRCRINVSVVSVGLTGSQHDSLRRDRLSEWSRWRCWPLPDRRCLRVGNSWGKDRRRDRGTCCIASSALGAIEANRLFLWLPYAVTMDRNGGFGKRCMPQPMEWSAGTGLRKTDSVIGTLDRRQQFASASLAARCRSQAQRTPTPCRSTLTQRGEYRPVLGSDDRPS